LALFFDLLADDLPRPEVMLRRFPTRSWEAAEPRQRETCSRGAKDYIGH